jgi:hypothetical protein
MMRCLLVLALLMCGCTTITTVEPTDTTRPVGPTTRRVYDKPARDDFLEFQTARELDGFEFTRSVLADSSGSGTVTLLPAALQCLAYGHDVTLSVYSVTQDREVYTLKVDPDRARQIIEEWRVQAALGARVPLRAGEKALMQRVIDTLADAPTVESLRAIAKSVEIVPDWR